MNARIHWKRQALHGLTLLAILAVALGAPAPARALLSNDEIETAIAVSTPPVTLTMSDADFNQSTVAVDDPVISCNGGPGLRTVWYSFVPTVYGEAVIDTFGSQFDTVLAIWTGTRGSLQAVTCNDDAANPGIYNNSEITVRLRPGVRYYIEVAQFTGGTAPQKKTSAAREIVPLASATWLTLNVKFSLVPTATVGKYDNKDRLWKYTGVWTAVTGLGHYLKTTQRTLVVGNTANLTFDGDQFTLYYMKASNLGRLEVWVDNVLVGTIIQTNPKTLYQQPWVSPVFTNGIHTLKLRNAYRYVNVDAILITAPPDLVMPGPITDLAAVPGATYGTVSLSWTATGDDGSDGLAKAYQVRYSAAPIVDQATWDAATAVTSVPTPFIPGSAESMTVSGLTPARTYYFAVRVLDEQGNPSAFGNSPSAVTGFAGPPAGAGTFDNLHSNWMYFGAWAKVLAAPAYLGSYHQSSKIGNSAFFVFDGIKFGLIYGMNKYHGNLDIYVDDVFVVRLNQYSSVQKYQQKYYSPLLAPGQHTVKFLHATGVRVDVDAIQVIQTPDVDNPAAVANLAAAPGAANGTVNLTWLAPVEDAGAGTGTAFYYLGRYSLNPIVTEDDWNAATPISAMPTPKAPSGAETKLVSGLTPGVGYYFSVRAGDEFDNLGPIVAAFGSAKAPVPAGAGKYDNKDTAHILYTNWALNLQPSAYLGSLHLSTLAGRTATFVFTGSDFSLIYARDTVFGTVEVWVDGVLMGTVDESGARVWQQVWKYSDFFGPLTAGQHTVVFRHATGSRVNLDAIEVFP